MAAGCTQPHKQHSEAVIDESSLQEGDLVFRLGKGMSSQIVNFADKETSYSHIGLLVKDTAGWRVIHVVPGEQEETGGRECVKSDPLSRFFSPDRTLLGLVVRYDSIAPIARQVAGKARDFYRRQILFDHRYLLSDTAALYCTELVYRAFLHARVDLSEGRRHTFPLVKEEIIFPSDILRNKAMHEVCRVVF